MGGAVGEEDFEGGSVNSGTPGKAASDHQGSSGDLSGRSQYSDRSGQSAKDAKKDEKKWIDFARSVCQNDARASGALFDMLLDGLPWALTMVALPWMPAPLMIDWRGSND